MDVIEKFGTGIMRINEEYVDSRVKPSFAVSKNHIRILLPVVAKESFVLSSDEQRALDALKIDTELSRSELERKTGFNKSKTIRILNSLIDKNVIERRGDGPSSTYRLR